MHIILTCFLKDWETESVWCEDSRMLSNKARFGLVILFPPAWTDQQQNRRTVAELWKKSVAGFNKRPKQTADAWLCQLLSGLPNPWLGMYKHTDAGVGVW